MLFEKALPQLLREHVRDDFGRRLELMKLVARLSLPPYAVPIGLATLQAEGRSPREAEYDHEMLVRLEEEHHVLWRPNRPLRGRRGGRRTDYWVMVPDIDRWRKIPFKTSRRQVWISFLAVQCPDDPRLVPKFADHVPRWVPPEGVPGSPKLTLLSTNQPGPSASQPGPSASEGASSSVADEAATGTQREQIEAPSAAHNSFRDTYVSPSLESDRWKGSMRHEELSEAGLKLLSALQVGVTERIVGQRLLATVDRLANTAGERFEELLEAARAIKVTKAWQAVDGLELHSKLELGRPTSLYRDFKPEESVDVDPQAAAKLRAIRDGRGRPELEELRG